MSNYQSIWRKFNHFVIRLDVKPPLWEDRWLLYCAYLIDMGTQSRTLKSYTSAVKKILILDGYKWNDSRVLLDSLTGACCLINDRVKQRLPIRHGLLELIFSELSRIFGESQPYLENLYQSLFSMAYYGLMRVGELTLSTHVLRAKNIHVAHNKNKIMIVLYTSKTHGKESRPQEIKISESQRIQNSSVGFKCCHFEQNIFCPFKMVRKYMALRGGYGDDLEQFFIFRDRSPVKPTHARTVLYQTLESLGLDTHFYDFVSFRSGRASDMLKYGYSVEQIKFAGRWKSNAVYNYIKTSNLYH